MFTASGDTFLTPKHIGMTSTLHQATRSKELVNMFNHAGHGMSYPEVIKLDNALDKKTVDTMDESGAVIPPNLVKGRFLHFLTDNVDINEYTLDGKGTFHATQVAAWQRGPADSDLLSGIDFSNARTLHIPDAMTDIIPAPNRGVTDRPFSGVIADECFTESPDQCPVARNAHSTDMAFIISRSCHNPMPSWTLYNQKASTVNPAELLHLSTVIDADHIAHMVEKLTSDRFQQAMKEFAEDLIADDLTAELWWNYLTMVSILLCFTRAQHGGLWDLHLYAFKRMLPFFFRYDHINFARWGSVYLAEMSDLPQEVLHEFQEGNFVVKRTDRQFNQVSADQSTEWLNATGEKSGGLIGITSISSAINRWALSFNLRNVISSQTAMMLGLTPDDEEDEYTHNECSKTRMERDDSDEGKILSSVQNCSDMNKCRSL